MRWTDDMRELVRTKYRSMGAAWCASKVGCTVPTMRLAAYFLGVARERRQAKDYLPQIRHLHSLGYTDIEIGLELDFSRTVIGTMRRRMKLKKNERMRKGVDAVAKVKDFWKKGLTDTQTAKVIGLSRGRVWSIRKELGLPANGKRGAA